MADGTRQKQAGVEGKIQCLGQDKTVKIYETKADNRSCGIPLQTAPVSGHLHNKPSASTFCRLSEISPSTCQQRAQNP